MIRQLFQLFAWRTRLRFLLIAVLTLLGAGAEIVGISLVLPFVSFAINPEAALDTRIIGTILKATEFTDRAEIMLVTGTGIVLLFAVKNLYMLIQWRIIYRILNEEFAELNSRLFDDYLTAPYLFHIGRNSSDLIRNTTGEVLAIFSGILRPLANLAADITMAVGLVALLLIVQPIALVAGSIVLGGISIAFIITLRHRMRRLGEIKVITRGSMVKHVYDSLSGIKEIKVLRREAYFVDRFRSEVQTFAMASRQFQIIGECPRLALETGAVVALVSVVVFIFVSGSQVSEELPMLALFGVALIRLMPAMSRIIGAVNAVNGTVASLQTVYDQVTDAALATPPPPRSETRSKFTFENEISLSGVTFTYHSALEPALRDVTLTIDKGGMVAFVGPSGAGKTTLVNLVLGLVQPSQGFITSDGVDVMQNLGRWQRLMGYIPQDIHMSDATIRENVAFGLPREEIEDSKVWAALEAAQLASFVIQLDLGLETEVGERGLLVSGGQRQRIGIARALYGDPQILVLDEATSSLDVSTERALMKGIIDLAGSRTILMVTHRISVAQHCDIVHVMEAGRVIRSGAPEQVLEVI